MDFAAEEELCQQAYEVWLHYACPACESDRSTPAVKPRSPVRLSSPCDGPCSILPVVFHSAFAGREGSPDRFARHYRG